MPSLRRPGTSIRPGCFRTFGMRIVARGISAPDNRNNSIVPSAYANDSALRAGAIKDAWPVKRLVPPRPLVESIILGLREFIGFGPAEAGPSTFPRLSTALVTVICFTPTVGGRPSPVMDRMRLMVPRPSPLRDSLTEVTPTRSAGISSDAAAAAFVAETAVAAVGGETDGTAA